jgi:small GTP-binding protein
MASVNDKLTFRVVLVGDSEAGKTSIVHRLVRNEFEPGQKPTVGAVFQTVARDIGGKSAMMQIWDTAGQEKYRSIGPIYYRNASAAIAVFDIMIEDFQSSLDSWIISVRRNASDPLIFIAGNKSDLLPHDESEAKTRIREFASKHQAPFFLVSAKTGRNIEALFDAVFDALLAIKHVQMQFIIEEELAPNTRKDCC